MLHPVPVPDPLCNIAALHLQYREIAALHLQYMQYRDIAMLHPVPDPDHLPTNLANLNRPSCMTVGTPDTRKPTPYPQAGGHPVAQPTAAQGTVQRRTMRFEAIGG
jgi:hypothetical protein